MKISDRYYFDFNATSPLSCRVRTWMGESDIFLANPSSAHTSGKRTKKLIKECRRYLYELFSRDSSEFSLIFHSGASEGINTLVKGFVDAQLKKNLETSFFYLKTDHSCIVNSAKDLNSIQDSIFAIDVDKNGEPDWKNLIDKINSKSGVKLINFTWANNESGVVLDLNKILEVKEKTGAFVHVDAVQAIGKIKDFFKLKDLDAYTFSGHKFGAMTGVGFSFVSKKFVFSPFIRGGGQQGGMRSGTENALGIYSLKLALEELIEKFCYEELLESKMIIEDKIKMVLKDHGEIIAESAKERSANTIYFIHRKVKGQELSMALDLAGMDVSNGSACSSGAVIPSRVVMAMGYGKDDALSAIRLSFSPYLTKGEGIEFSKKIASVLERFCS